MLQDVLSWLRNRCPNIRFSLSDKDMSEINACRTVLLRVKHQLCLWHAIRYLVQRLKESKPPAAYDPRAAYLVFNFIDPTWSPGVENGNSEETFDGRESMDFELEVNDIPVCAVLLLPRQSH